METRDFPVAVIASISTCMSLCAFNEIHEAAEYLMGHPIWTHQFADKTLWLEMRSAILEQCPDMITEANGVNSHNVVEFIAKLEADLGKIVKIRKGSGLTALLPTDGIPDHLKDSVIVVKTGGES